jgi:DNA/RNA endonuclease YhcR with UshA esterase domain
MHRCTPHSICVLLVCITILALFSPSGAGVVINEVRVYSGSAQPEFIELRGDPDTDLGDFTVEGIYGASGDTYILIDLDGAIPDDGYFLIAGDSSLGGVDHIHEGLNMQNWDANLLLKEGENTVDALAYVKDEGDTLQFSYGEGDPAIAPEYTKSIGRYPDGIDTHDNAVDFSETTVSSPGASNGGEEGIITVVSPNGGEAWPAGSPQMIEWTSVGNFDDVKIDYSLDAGSTWIEVTAQTPDDGSYGWTTPDTASTTCLVKIADLDDDPSDRSDTYFVIGSEFIPIGDIQAYDENGDSPFEGQTVRITGTVTVPSGMFHTERTDIYIQDATGGVNVFGFNLLSPPAALGDSLIVEGEVTEYEGKTEVEFGNPADVQNLGPALNPYPAPLELRTGVVEESHEGLLVATEGVIVSKRVISDIGLESLYIDDGSGETQIFNNFREDISFAAFKEGDMIQAVGVVLQYDTTAPYLSGYQIAPRTNDEVQIKEIEYSEKPVLIIENKVFHPVRESGALIRFNAPEGSKVTIFVYDVKGREVTVLYDDESQGEAEIRWNGRDRHENLVSPGTYICYMETVLPKTGKRYASTKPIVVVVDLR